MYTVGMKSIQYTVRNVPPAVDNALRLRAKKNKQSFNATVVQILSKSTTGLSKKNGSDLDWFYGSGGLGQAELDAFAKQRVIDGRAWDL